MDFYDFWKVLENFESAISAAIPESAAISAAI
jgi:hypothetical protein